MNGLFDSRRDAALVSTAWLAEHLDDADVLVIDMRKGDGYALTHVPGAVAHGGSPFLRDSGDVIVPGEFAAMMSRLGVDASTHMIAYDDGNGLFAARLWWVARYYGFDRIRVLDGGWDLWLAEARATDAVIPTRRATYCMAQPQADLIASTDYVDAALASSATMLLDVRGDEEWTRTIAEGTSVAGHIPGARHLFWTTVIDAATRQFRDGAQLRRLFLNAGVVPGTELIPYCQGGIRAAHTMLALFLAGLDPARNYEGSWAAWSKSGLPVEAFKQDQNGSS